MGAAPHGKGHWDQLAHKEIQGLNFRLFCYFPAGKNLSLKAENGAC
jgi:hypothetical protein